MGCAISNFHSRIVDLSKRSDIQSNVAIVSPHNLHRFLNDDDPNPKVIFIFGGSGSNKGQFIWEILEQSCENYHQNENNEMIKLIIECDDDQIDLNRFRFSYYYVDVEKLIVENLESRIKKLTINPNPLQHNNFMKEADQPQSEMANLNLNTEQPAKDSDLLLDIPENLIRKRRRSSAQDEALKNQLLLYANVITNSWILSLLKKEIEDNNNGPYEKIFIINLIPNRITIFKDCLFLKQTPSFVNFEFNYCAIRLVKHSSRRKELEIKTEGSRFDEINNNYVNYFKFINKLFEIRVRNIEEKIRLKLTTSKKNSIPIWTKADLISFIHMPKKDLLEVNITEFNFELFETILKKSRTTSLLFIINKEVDLDDQIKFIIMDDKYDLVFLRKFIQLYRLTTYSLRFV